jgi:uncharacterized RDD family membrane protein YckC
MNCPVCNRSLAPTLSICPSCGAMMFDSVREELQSKITSGRLVKKAQPPPEPAIAAAKIKLPEPAMPVFKVRTPEAAPPLATRAAIAVAPALERQPAVNTPVTIAVSEVVESVPVAKPVRRVETTDLSSPKTSPTLLGFQSKNPTIPDWRLQLQNAVQQRKGGQPITTGTAPAAATRVRAAAPRTEMALQADVPADSAVPASADPRVANAMRRIAESRQTFLEKEQIPVAAPRPSVPKVHRFDLHASTPAISAPSNGVPLAAKPRLVAAAPVAVPLPVKRDTNKLPPIVLDRTNIDNEKAVAAEEISKPLTAEFSEIKRIRIAAEHHEPEEIDLVDAESEEIEDLAHVSMRFGAGLFDFIITSFMGLMLLSPVLFTRDGWFSPAGLLAFAGVTAVVMFIYMTVCLGFYGKTVGMRLFSLELVDAVENEYPTLHQAAVNSSVFILSLIFGGLGFLTMLFNEEKRAAHDLLSGTILVREF